MIEVLTGKIIYRGMDYIVLDVSGIGYKVSVTPDTLSSLRDNDATLWTHLAVRESALDLYGFLVREDLKFFELLLGISGVGPKSALAILSLADTETLTNAIAGGDTAYLTRVSGIGKKSAARIVIELKDKVGGATTPETLKEDSDTLDALITMGYSTIEVREALKKLPKTLVSAKERIREALKLLSNKI